MWLRPHLRVFSTFGNAAASLSQFFRQQENQESNSTLPTKRLASASVMQDNFGSRTKYADRNSILPDLEKASPGTGSDLPSFRFGAAKVDGLVELAKGAASHQVASENVTSMPQSHTAGRKSLVNMLQRTQKEHSQRYNAPSSFRLSEQLRPAPAHAPQSVGTGAKTSQQMMHKQGIDKSTQSTEGNASISSDTKAFLQRAKSSLSANGLLKFKGLILSFKKDGKTIESFLVFMEDLAQLLQVENATELLGSLAMFIPPGFAQYYERFLHDRGFGPVQKHAGGNDAVSKLPSSSGKQKQICMICNKNVENAHAALCGHIACYSCWKTLLQRPEQRKCPICGTDVDRAKLVKKFFV